MHILSELDRVFQVEIDTLVSVRERLDGSHVKAAELLLACSGKVVVAGMGKSGFVAQKIASTMASTGTPAIFLHPGDGMHGDVGIIQEADVFLAVSKSGESEELLQRLGRITRTGPTAIGEVLAAPGVKSEATTNE